MLRKSYGIVGRTKYWRILQKEIQKVRTDFNPEGLNQYWIDNAKIFNEESFKMIRDIEIYFKKDFRKTLQKKYGENWFTLGCQRLFMMKQIKLLRIKTMRILP